MKPAIQQSLFERFKKRLLGPEAAPLGSLAPDGRSARPARSSAADRGFSRFCSGDSGFGGGGSFFTGGVTVPSLPSRSARAKQVGVDADALEEAVDSDGPKEATIELLIQAMS